MNRLNEALELLGKMVAIPSVEGAEKEMGDFLSEYTASLGMTVEKQIVEENRSNIIARVQIGKGAKQFCSTLIWMWCLREMAGIPIHTSWLSKEIKRTAGDPPMRKELLQLS